MSVTYNHVRSRQLEGTFPGSAETGVWISTYLRTMKGWGCVDEELWPYDGRASTWPEPEPPGLDLQAKSDRIGIYQRVNTVEEFCRGIYTCGSVLGAFEIDDSWNQAPNGVISLPSNQPVTAVHCVCLYGYDKQRFYFVNSWGADWGQSGSGTLPYSYLSTHFLEGYAITYPQILPHITPQPIDSSQMEIRTWKTNNLIGEGMVYGAEIVDPVENEMIAWGFAIERETSFDIEELFVRPNWRRQGYGSQLATSFSQRGADLGKKLHAWVSHPDGVQRNEVALDKILHRLGLSRRPSPVRWATAVGIDLS